MFIKKLVMHGFKSFPKKTEIPFTQGINVILGPNGSGKSNVSDALCFVLGRLSVKSMRAAKARNLIFLGSKSASPAKEAYVEISFDNSEKVFSIEKNEVTIKRIVRRNGQSIYKINGETKTRQEILSLLAQAGIDPNGFNIILQGEIQNFVNMHTEERRKVIEEVSGIAIYESRKSKSLKELERTDNRLKEVLAILKERTSYLNNLERERQQALKFKRLEKHIKALKASIINSELSSNKKNSEKVDKEIELKNKEIEKIRKNLVSLNTFIESCKNKIESINSTIEKSTGLEQERLNQEIANLRAEIAATTVRIDNFESKLSELQKQKNELVESIRNSENLIHDLKKDHKVSISQTSIEKEIDLKKKEIEKFESARKKFYSGKSELKSMKHRIEDKKSLLNSYVSESEFLANQIKAISKDLFNKKADKGKLDGLKNSMAEKKLLLNDFLKKERELEKISSAREYEIDKQKNIVKSIPNMEICPLCKSKITPEHIEGINKDVNKKIESLNKDIAESDKKLSEIYGKKDTLTREIENLSEEIKKMEYDLIKISGIKEKDSQIKNLYQKIEVLKSEISEIEKIRNRLEKEIDSSSNIEQKYETARIELHEISTRSEETIDSEISFKQRELERMKITLKQISTEESEISEELKNTQDSLEDSENLLDKKRKQDEVLSEKFEKMIGERDDFYLKIRKAELDANSEHGKIREIENSMNELKIEKAKLDAVVENLEIEMLSFPNVDLIRGSKEVLSSKLQNAQETKTKIGSVNLRSLEVYDSVKKEYETIKEKTEIIEKEKNSILKIIKEIDVKKKKSFLKTLDSLNEIFSRNFSQLSTKGTVSLNLENRKDPFDGGVGIVVKTGHGKYFDVKSLSGGEQTLVALSLIFAIQELKPYYFYILDEIDAALDKRNSERLASLLRKYMQKGQYIVITHNDEVITNATNLYGVSMYEGISKIISLKI